jgi:hypothetical protein
MEKFVKTTKADDTSSITLSQLSSIFGRPPLLKGEDREAYRKLQKAIAAEMRPENALDALEVQEMVDSMWEGRRFQKMGTKLLDAEHQRAVGHLTNSVFGYVSEAAEKWFESLEGTYPDGMTEADVLKKMGLSPELVQAHGVLFAAEHLAVVERLASNRVAARRVSLKDYARRKRLEAKDKRLAAKNEMQHRDLANDNRPPAQHPRKPRKKSSS